MENNETIFSEFETIETEASITQRITTSAIDFGFDIIFLILIYQFILQRNLQLLPKLGSFEIFIFIIILIHFYQSFFLLTFNKTIGMMICRVKLLNNLYHPLSIKEKLLSLFRTRYSAIKLNKDK